MCLGRGLTLRRMVGVSSNRRREPTRAARSKTRRAGELFQPVGDRLRLQPAFDAWATHAAAVMRTLCSPGTLSADAPRSPHVRGCASPVSPRTSAITTSGVHSE